MTSDLEDIRAALKKTMGQAGLNGYDVIADVINQPAAIVEPHDVNFGRAFAMGSDTYYFNVYLLVANKVTREAQRKLDTYLTGRGPKSIREFIFRNQNLGLPDVQAFVEGMVKGSYGANYEVGATKFVGAALRVCVIVN